MKKIISIVLSCAILCGVFAGCNSTPASSASKAESTAPAESSAAPAQSTPATSGEKPKVAFICKSYSDAFCVWVKDEMEKKAKSDYADLFELVCFDAENNANKQIDQINNCAANNFNIIVLQQVDAQAPVAAVKDAVAKGVKVIVTTGHIEDDGASVYIDASPKQQGFVVAEYASTKLPENAKVAIIQGPAGNFHANGRQEGMEEALAKRGDITIVDKQIGEWKKEKGLTITQNWLSSIPDLKGILCHNDDMALGAYEAIKMAGKEGQIQIYGVDALAAAVVAVKDGNLMATVFQNAVAYSDISLDYISKIIKGETVESVNIESDLVTPDNVNTYIELHKQLGNL
ncbi:sugar ABC transporter substrate-binding protein [Oscillospiraceae bacterium PP1C4]